MSVAIKIDGIAVDLKTATVNLEKPSGLLDFDSVSPTISSQVALAPTRENELRFGFLHRPASRAAFDISTATLEWRKIQIASGEFLINSAAKKGQSGFFRADAGELAQFRDQQIGDLLAPLVVNLTSLVTAHNADVVFPPCIGRQAGRVSTRQSNVRTDRSVYLASDRPTAPARGYDRNNKNQEFSSQRNNTEEFSSEESGIEEILFYNQTMPYSGTGRALDIKYLPAFKLKHLLEEIALAMGYTLRIPATDYTLEYAIIFGRNSTRDGIFTTRSYSEYLPSLTVSEFINSMRAMGTAITIDSSRKEIVAQPFDSLAKSLAKDITPIAVPEPVITEAFGKEPSTFAFSQETANEPNVLSPEDDILPVPNLGDFGYYYRENRIYEGSASSFLNSDFTVWRWKSAANITESISKGGKEVQSLFVPVGAGRLFYFTCENIKIRQSGGGKVMLDNLKYSTFVKANYVFRIIAPEELSASTFFFPDFDPTEDAPVINIPYTQDYDDAIIEYAYTDPNGKVMPDLPSEVAPYIALYHGPYNTGLETYGYASPTGYSPSYATPYTRLTDQDLNMASILKNRMATAKRIFERGKLAKYKLMPRAVDLANWSSAPVAVDGVKFLPKTLDAQLGDGPLEADFEGWVLQGE